jgi:hypothetical protein
MPRRPFESIISQEIDEVKVLQLDSLYPITLGQQEEGWGKVRWQCD